QRGAVRARRFQRARRRARRARRDRAGAEHGPQADAPRGPRRGVLRAVQLSADGARRRAPQHGLRRQHVSAVAERGRAPDAELPAAIQLAQRLREHGLEDVLGFAAGQGRVAAGWVVGWRLVVGGWWLVVGGLVVGVSDLVVTVWSLGRVPVATRHRKPNRRAPWTIRESPIHHHDPQTTNHHPTRSAVRAYGSTTPYRVDPGCR